MTVISTYRDPGTLTLTFVTEFTASVDRVWQVWQDPRQLERWWGPPGWPATFEQHDFVVGGESKYHMTGPSGEKARGWWTITAIDAPHRLEFDDGFADEPLSTMDPTHNVVTIEAVDAGARMTTVTTFASVQQMEQILAIGMEEGMRLALGQIDELLTAAPR